ncbi:surface antigen [Lacticaseibacillus saniviri JCM 17471 = DSM 24301]|uniref:Surface antigen n=1 Tax=Lacticaseibacillus saniviri JCM 17471 = DSM 24301 TaxID=1293598 RepID=A0A0R2MU34_9LACO|nr:surface antigen [Lacticaseibacillus saniviri JCM 17471 = DSM 24301]
MKSLKKRLVTIAAAGMIGLTGMSFGTQSQLVAAASAGEVVTINYVPNYGIAVWDSPQANHHATGKTLKHNSSWKVVAKQVVNGKTWYNLGGAQWIEGAYTIDGYPVPSNTVVTINYKPNYGIAVWNSPEAGHQATGKTLKHNTTWKVVSKQVVNGKTWYNLGGAQWIDSTYTINGYPSVSQAPSAHPDYTGQTNTYPWGQCTYYVKMVAPWVGNYWGNGTQWGTSAKRVGFSVNKTPQAGSVVVFTAGQWVGSWQADRYYGHVAYVKSYNPANNSITITQGGMGFNSPTGPNTQVVPNATNFSYIHR